MKSSHVEIKIEKNAVKCIGLLVAGDELFLHEGEY
jgi:hypothetical protein